MSDGNPRESDSGDESQVNSQQLGMTALEEGRLLAALAMKGAPTPQKVIVFACYAVFGLCVLGLLVPPWESTKQLVVLAIGAVVLLVTIVLVIVRYTHLAPVEQTTSGPTPSPPSAPTPPDEESNDVPHEHATPSEPESVAFSLDLPDAAFRGVREALEEARRAVYEFLLVKNSNLVDEDVRANIFAPHFDNPNGTSTSVLGIYPGLHIHMNNPAELGIRFSLSEGATGKVFITGKARVARRIEGGEQEWEDDYVMTPDLEATVHPDLKWVLCVALNDRNGRVMAVMTVDGLNHSFSYDELYDCVGQLAPKKTIIQKFIERFVKSHSK